MSDDADLEGSVFGISGILGSPLFAFSFLLGLSVGGSLELTSSVLLSLLLGSELVLDLNKLSLGFLSQGGELLSLIGELNNEGFEVLLGLNFLDLVVDDGLLE